MRAASVTPRPAPPYCSGIRTPSQPLSAKARTNSTGYSARASLSSQYSSENVRASAPTSFRISSWDSVSAKSMSTPPGRPAAEPKSSTAAGLAPPRLPRYPRTMETTPAIQDYLGAIYDLAGSEKPVIGARLARYMHLSAPSITEAVRRMQKEGYVRLDNRKEIRLTDRGLSIAETMARRHRLLERWLTDVLGLDWARAHDEAHRLEHALSPLVEERLAETLGMPSTCPHGYPIPGMPPQ